MKLWRALLWIGLIASGLTACQALTTLMPPPTRVETPGVAFTPPPTRIAPSLTSTVALTPSPTRIIPRATPTIRPGPTLSVSETITLTVWLPEDLAPGETRAGRVLRAQYDAFDQAHPQIRLDVLLKKPYGKGGLLDFLLTAQTVVPDLLPDVIALDAREVPAAARAGLLQPLDADFPAGTFADLFDPAQKMAQRAGHWIALPALLDVQHLVYDPRVLTTAPRSWDDVLTGSEAFLFPADGDDGFLLQYLSLGGRVVDEGGQPVLDVPETAQVLDFYLRARNAGLISDAALGLKTVGDVWPIYAAGQAAMAQVSGRQYFTEREKLTQGAYAAVPTREGQSATLATGWVYAVVTRDPARHTAAVEFLRWLHSPDNLGRWAATARQFPASRSAFAIAVEPAGYADFARDLLDHAYAMPADEQIARSSRAWRLAVAAVLKGQATPNEAALEAAKAVKE
jgi:ABC-type glycerol-3-phosphate transport system substrate-binding protein